ncbi:uncharacterized protein LOC128682513 [Plodia interpunctella]|uniref:uncharacterized protein LOC128682513 n=1 Tax=Plodia interpunctella TaxID=58824 RepID=UPI002368A2BD|nr:uncharacterized protein LOC128682513 [Plodia interpunctella]
MTVGEIVLNTAKSMDSLYPSPPPEVTEIIPKKWRRKIFKAPPACAKVDTSPPPYNKLSMTGRLRGWSRRLTQITMENFVLLQNIKRWQMAGGKVDCHWDVMPAPIERYYRNRVDHLKLVQRENKVIHRLITDAVARVETTENLRRAWRRNRNIIVQGAQGKFVLFPPVPQETIEDPVFITPPGVKRPRVYLTLRVKNCAPMGELAVELFTDFCPQNCRLFTELLDGDGLGHGYVGTSFFRKVPNLYWSGGDVIYNNGFGCYAQKDRRVPIGADNYHFSHSIPGLVSMRVTADNEMCGIFNITFKPMPQFDLKNVVIGRVIRPSNLYDEIRGLGSALCLSPVIEVSATRRRVGGQWRHGLPNQRLLKTTSKLLKDIQKP